MNEIANTSASAPDRLNDLAMQARTFAQNACMNLLQLGRVLAEARPLIPHGQFDGWCRQNAKMSRRTAEQYMQAYAEFGLNMKIAELGTTKIIKLLPMSEEERERLMSENDVGAMSTRQMDEAIRRQREQIRAEAYAEAQERIDAAERRAKEAENRPPEIPAELTDQLRDNSRTIAEQRAEIARLADAGRQAMEERQRLARENSGLKRDLRERDEDMEAMQADFNRAQEELLNLQSQQARGDADRIPADTLTADAFAMAVNTFVGTCCRLPMMGRAFSRMKKAEKERYDEALRAIEHFARGARQAVNGTEPAEVIVIE